MLFLLFQVGEERYALDAGHVAEVIPLVENRYRTHLQASLASVIAEACRFQSST